MTRVLFACCLLLPVSAAWAGSCAEEFQSVGDARNGLLFATRVKLANTTAHSAIGQLRQIAADGGYELGSELYTGDSGEFTFMQMSNHPPLVIQVLANNAGEISLGLKLAQGQKTRPEAVRDEFCSMLGKLKSGKEGESLAAAAREKTGADRIIQGKADRLSADIGADVRSQLRAVASKGNFSRWLIGTGPVATDSDFNAAFAPVRARYIGRRYRIDGQIYTSTRNSVTGGMEINYLVTPKRGLLGVQQESQYNSQNFQLTCVLAADQSRLFATLSGGDFVTLEGQVTQMFPGGMTLEQCRQAKLD